jgi:hypothetical protein
MTRDDAIFMQAQYQKFCAPLSRLDELRRFYVHVELPLPWVAKIHTDIPTFLGEPGQAIIQDKEAEMEALVCNDKKGKKQKYLDYQIPQFLLDTEKNNWFMG